MASDPRLIAILALSGAVAYGGYQVGKLTSKFGSYGYGRGGGWGFNDWNR